MLLSFGQFSASSWHQESGERWTVTQAEGGEQGEPLMPLFFSNCIQGALEEVSRSLETQKTSGCVDDVYLVGEALLRVAGIHLHQGKTRVWTAFGQSRSGTRKGSRCWRHLWEALSMYLPSRDNGWQRSGGCGRLSQPSVTSSTRGRFCCRAHVRTLPPSVSQEYAETHNEHLDHRNSASEVPGTELQGVDVLMPCVGHLGRTHCT